MTATSSTTDRSPRRTAGWACTTSRSRAAATGGPYPIGCTGDVIKNPCPSSIPSTNIPYTLNEGSNVLSVTATDASDNVSAPSPNWLENIDRSAPVLANLSGSLTQYHAQTVRDGETYTLHMDATDGSLASNATKRSGVAKLELQLDGQLTQTWTQSCPDSSCPMARDWDFHPERYANGWHLMTVTATDHAGHTSAPKATWSTSCMPLPRRSAQAV